MRSHAGAWERAAPPGPRPHSPMAAARTEPKPCLLSRRSCFDSLTRSHAPAWERLKDARASRVKILRLARPNVETGCWKRVVRPAWGDGCQDAGASGYAFPRRSLGTRGNERQREATSGNERQRAATSGNERQREATRGNERQREATRGNERQRAATSGNARTPAAFSNGCGSNGT